MTDLQIATQLVATFEDRAQSYQTSLMYYPYTPYMEVHPSCYVAVRISDITIWDNEDETSHPSDGETFETALAHAEKELSSIVVALRALLTRGN